MDGIGWVELIGWMNGYVHGYMGEWKDGWMNGMGGWNWLVG